MITVTAVISAHGTPAAPAGGLAFGRTIPVTDVIQSLSYYGAKLHLSSDMYPEIWNKSLAGPSQYVWQMWSIVPRTSTTFDQTNFDSFVTT